MSSGIVFRSPEETRRSPEGTRRSPEGTRRSPEEARRSLEEARRSLEGTRRSLEGTRRSPKKEATLRLERAKELLRETTLSVAQIAERVGYAEAKYFIAVFHRAVGTTPLRYRRDKE